MHSGCDRFSWDGVWQAVSALAALGAVFFAYLSIREARASARKQKEGFYFERLMVTPTLAAIDEFRTRVLELLHRGAEEIEVMGPAATSAAVNEHVGKLVASFNRAWEKLFDVVTTGAEALNLEDLRDRVKDEVEDLQDEMTQEIARLSNSREGRQFSAIVRQHTADLMAHVRRSDPGLT